VSEEVLEAPRTRPHYTFTLKMATAMFAETLFNTQHSTRLTPDSKSYTFISFVNFPCFRPIHANSFCDGPVDTCLFLPCYSLIPKHGVYFPNSTTSLVNFITNILTTSEMSANITSRVKLYLLSFSHCLQQDLLHFHTQPYIQSFSCLLLIPISNILLRTFSSYS
jgi:hypothetical protein